MLPSHVGHTQGLVTTGSYKGDHSMVESPLHSRHSTNPRPLQHPHLAPVFFCGHINAHYKLKFIGRWLKQNSSYLGRHHHDPEPNLVDSQTKIQQTPQPSIKTAHLYAVIFCGRIESTIKTRVHRKMVKQITHYLVITMTLTLISSTRKLGIPSTSTLSKMKRIRNAVTGDIERPKTSGYNMSAGSLANLYKQITES